MAKLTSSERRARLLMILEEQRHLLSRAIDQITAGDLAQALHIATILRVLVHETGASKPLLKQLTTSYLDLPILDEPPPAKDANEKLPPGVQKAVVLSVPIHFKLSPEGIFLNPELPGLQAPSTVGKWWERNSLIIPGFGGYSRREIVLGLANKEGGAHVDLGVSKRYQGLLDYKSFRLGFGPLSDVTAVNLSRFMVGQAGVEMLEWLARNFPPAASPEMNATKDK